MLLVSNSLRPRPRLHMVQYLYNMEQDERYNVSAFHVEVNN